MLLRQESRHAIRIARTELRRGWRSAVDRWSIVGVGLGLCLFAGWTLFLGGIGYLLGSIAGGEALTITDSTSGQLVGWVLFLAALISFQVVENRARIDNEELLFTTVSARTVLLGLLSAELARESLLFGSFVLVGTTGIALGLGAPALVPVVVLASLPVLVLVVLLGHTAGIAAKLLAERMSGFGWLRTVLGAVLGLLIGLGPMLFFGGADWLGLSLDVGSLLAVIPIAAYADLLAIGTPLRASLGLDTALAAVLVLGSIPLLFALDARLARALWFGGSDGATASRTDARTPPALLSRGSTGWLVWWYWLRGLRAPSRFTHLIYYSFPLFWLVFDAIREPSTLPTVTSTVLVVLGVAFAGAAFGLNPLGDERNALPAVLSTPGVERFVRARVVAGLPWAVLACAGVALGGVVGRFEPTTATLLGVVVLALCMLSATVAPVFGLALPRFEPVAASNSEVITPSFGATVGHAAVVGTASAVGLLAVFGPRILGSLSGLTPSFATRAALVCVVSLVVLGTSLAAYRYAAGRFRTATIS